MQAPPLLYRLPHEMITICVSAMATSVALALFDFVSWLAVACIAILLAVSATFLRVKDPFQTPIATEALHLPEVWK